MPLSSVAIINLENSAAGRALALTAAVNLNTFVDFTSGLVREVFKTLIASTLEQLEAYADLLAKVSGTAADYEAKALGDVDATAVDYVNTVVLPSFSPPGISPPTLGWTSATGTGTTPGTPTLTPATPSDVSFDPSKKQDLMALFDGINAAVVTVPQGSTLQAAALTTFATLLVESGTTLTMDFRNLHTFAVAKLKRDAKASYDKVVTLLQLGLSKIVIPDGSLMTSITLRGRLDLRLRPQEGFRL